MNDYTYHSTMLANPKARLPVTEDDPQPGRYRLKRNGEWKGVAIWYDAQGVLNVLVDGEAIPHVGMSQVWTSCARHPISETEYERLVGADDASDPIYAALPDDAEGLLERVRRLAAIPTAIDDADEARRLADAAHLLKQIETRCAETYKDAAAPHAEKIGRLKVLWGEPEGLAKAARDPVMSALTRFLKGKNEPGGVKGQLGRAISLRTYSVLEITDYDAALAHFVKADPEAFKKTVEKLARAAIKNGEVPGVKHTEDKRAQ